MHQIRFPLGRRGPAPDLAVGAYSAPPVLPGTYFHGGEGRGEGKGREREREREGRGRERGLPPQLGSLDPPVYDSLRKK